MPLSLRDLITSPDFGMMLLCSAGFMAVGLYRWYRAMQLLENSALTWGVIVGTKNRRRKHRYYVQGGIYPIIAFETEDGHVIEFEGKVSIDSLDADSNKVPVRYHRQSPNWAVIDHFVPIWGGALYGLFGGLLFPVIYLVLRLSGG